MKKLILFAILLFPQISVAQSYKILAVVNGESVSTQQIRDRVKLIMSTSGMADTAANKKKVTKEVADILVNEILQKQEAREKGINLDQKEMNAIFADLEKKNKLKPGGFKDFVAKKGISYAAVKDQIVSTIVWKKVLQTYVRPGVTVTKEDIERARAEIAARPKIVPKSFVNISEIIIPVEFGKEKEAKELADTIVRTARAGAKDFGELAQKYSVGKTAPNKGQAGWLPEGGMIEPLASAVKKTAAGKVTEPISTQSMYVILKINERRTDAPPVDNTKPEDLALMKKLEEAAKKYVKGLRDKAYIEKKYKDENLYSEVWG